MNDIPDKNLLFKALKGDLPDNSIKYNKRSRLSDAKEHSIKKVLDLEAIRAEKAKRNFKEFVVNAWPHVEKNTPFIDNWHIGAVCEHLNAVASGQIDNIIINIPPRSSKSYLCSVMFPAWLWINQPHLKFLCASHSYGLALDLARKYLTTIRSKWYRRGFGYSHKLTSTAVGKVRNNHLGERFAVSPGSPITGLGGHYIIGDDILDAEESNSEQVRKGVNNWWTETLSSRLEGRLEDAHKIIVMQRLHYEDLTGFLLEQGGWDLLMIPMEYDPKRSRVTSIGWKDPRTKEGELMDPKRFSQIWVDKQKGENKSGANPDHIQEKSSYVWAGQYQQSPIPAGGGLVKEEWLTKTFYNEDPRDIYRRANKIIFSWDCSFKDTASSDYVVGQVWAKIGPHLYLLHQERARMDVVQTVRAIQNMAREFPRCQEKLVEDKANGPAVISFLKNKIQGLIPIPVNAGDSKEGRLVSILWLIEAGNVHLPNPKKFDYSWIQETIDEWTRFPLAPHDDTVDAMVHALTRLQDIQIDPLIVPFGVGHGNRFQKDWQPSELQFHRDSVMSNWGVNRD